MDSSVKLQSASDLGQALGQALGGAFSGDQMYQDAYDDQQDKLYGKMLKAAQAKYYSGKADMLPTENRKLSAEAGIAEDRLSARDPNKTAMNAGLELGLDANTSKMLLENALTGAPLPPGVDEAITRRFRQSVGRFGNAGADENRSAGYKSISEADNANRGFDNTMDAAERGDIGRMNLFNTARNPGSTSFDLGAGGAVLNNITGAVDVSNPMAQAAIAKDNAMASGGGRIRPKTMPSWLGNQQAADLDAIALASSLSADNQQLVNMLKGGNLELGPVDNLVSRGLNFAGMSTPNSRNLATMQATLEKMRNDSLKLNKGVQTEGDAVRAWNEIFQNMNDPQLVQDRLQTIAALNQRAAGNRLAQLNIMRQSAGYDPLTDEELSTLTHQTSPIAPSVDAQLPIGTVEDGHRYIGGDPANPASWEPI